MVLVVVPSDDELPERLTRQLRRPVTIAGCSASMGLTAKALWSTATGSRSYGRTRRVAATRQTSTPGTQIKEFSRRKKLFGGEKEHLLQVIVNVGTFYSLKVPAERRAEVDALIAALEKARDSATS